MLMINSGGFLQTLIKYQWIISPLLILVAILLVYGYSILKNKVIHNDSKVAEIDMTKVKFLPGKELVGIDDIYKNMAINSYESHYTSIVSASGTRYKTLMEDEKTGVCSSYINFLNTINFPFSKTIISKKIDVEKTIDKYENALAKKMITLDELHEKYENVKDNPPHDETLLFIKKQIRVTRKDIVYLRLRIGHINEVIESVSGTNKSIHYSVNSAVDSESLKGLEPKDYIHQHRKNLDEKVNALRSSLGNMDIVTSELNDIEILNLARMYYKPISSYLFKTSEIINNTDIESTVILSPEIFAKVKMYEERKRMNNA